MVRISDLPEEDLAPIPFEELEAAGVFPDERVERRKKAEEKRAPSRGGPTEDKWPGASTPLPAQSAELVGLPPIVESEESSETLSVVFQGPAEPGARPVAIIPEEEPSGRPSGDGGGAAVPAPPGTGSRSVALRRGRKEAAPLPHREQRLGKKSSGRGRPGVRLCYA